MILTQVVQWQENTEELKRNLAQGLDQVEALRAGAESMLKSFNREKRAARLVKKIRGKKKRGGK